MNNITPGIGRFARRVRLVYGWKGLAYGAIAGAVGATSWAILDVTGFAYADGRWLIYTVAAPAILGGVAGLLWRVPTRALTRSIDRRAHLMDRLDTAIERTDGDGLFDSALREDAESQFAQLQPKTLYPLVLTRWHGGSFALCAMAAAVFLLGNSPIFLSGEGRQNRKDLQQQGEKVERIEKETFETPEAKAQMSAEEKRLADEMKRYRRELEKAHISPEESMQKASDIAKKAKELLQESAKKADQSLETAQQAWQDKQSEELQKAGLQNADLPRANRSPEELDKQKAQAEQHRQEAQKNLNELRAKLDALDKKLRDPKLSKAERAALEKQRKELAKKADDAKKSLANSQKELQDLKLSKEAAETLRKLQSDPLYKEIQELAKKLKQNDEAAKSGDRPSLSDAERAEMRKQLDELLKKLQSDEAMKAYLEALKEALKNADSMGRSAGVMAGLLPISMPGTGGPGNSVMLHDTGKVNHSVEAQKSQGTASTTMISGSVRPGLGDEPYVEIKAPSTIGNRSSVPLVKVLPSFRRKAESALNRQEIPQDQQKRVRDYFNSISH